MIKRISIFSFLLAFPFMISAQIRYSIPFPSPLKSDRDTVSVLLIGDVMMHSRQMEYDMDTFLGGIRHELEAADISIANMEFSLGGKPYTGYPAFSAPDSYASYVADCGVDVFLTANNHIMDRREKGLERTLRIYRSMKDSIRFTGASSDEAEKAETYPLLLRRKGICIALVNFTYGTNIRRSGAWPTVNVMDTTEVRKAISRARESGADFIIALPHWGNEYVTKHSASQEKWAVWLAGEGVDAIIGSHPHVVQDTTHIGEVPVIYSLGNAVSNMSATNTRLELAARILFTKDPVSGETAMSEPELRFMWCTVPNMLTGSYCTIFVDEWKGRRECWKNPADYDNMIRTYRNVLSETGIKDEKNN